MKKTRITVFTGLAFLALVIALLATTLFGSTVFRGKAVHAASANKCGQWSIIPSGKPNSGNIFTDVAVISANDVWAVGFRPAMGYSRTFAEHWNGKAWKAVPTLNIGALGNYLHGIVAFASNNVWAVGYYQSKSGAFHTLIEHWDGTAWKIVASPNADSNSNFLFSATALSANDIWTVGYFMPNNISFQTLVEHWDGSAWKVVPSPNVNNLNSSLNRVAVVSKNDIWSVGETQTGDFSHSKTLIEHWNGAKWQIVASPNPSPFQNSLWGIGVVAANNIWAVGYTAVSGKFGNTLTEHWDGTAWKVVASPTPMSRQHLQNLQPFHAQPNFGESANTLQGLVVISATNIWAVGNYVNSSNAFQSLIEHWDGKQWSVVASPNPTSNFVFLWSAARVGNTTQVWAVGSGATSPLTEFYC